MEPDAPLSPFAVPNKRSSWQQRLLRYAHRHFASFLSQWKSMHSPLLVDFHSFCRILLPSEYQCKSQVPLTNAPRPTAVTSRLHANASSTHEELDASLREAYNPSTSLGSSRTTELVHRKVEFPGKGNAGYWPHLRDANLPLQADGGVAASGEGCGSDEAAGITETAQLQKLAEDVWAAFQDRGGLEIFQVLGGMAWLLPTCLNAKARAFCSIFDITGTGGLTFAELSILLDRSLAGLAKIVGCPVIETLAAPYCREFIRKAVSERDAPQEEQESDEISPSRDEEEGEYAEESDEEQDEGESRDDEENDDDDDMAVATSTDEVPLALFINILHEIERRIASALQGWVYMADTLRLTFPSDSLPWVSWLQPGASFMGRYEVLKLLHPSRRCPHARAVLQVQERTTGILYALKLIVNRDGPQKTDEAILQNSRQYLITSSLDDASSYLPHFYDSNSGLTTLTYPSLRLFSFLAEASHMQKRQGQVREENKAQTARCVLYGEVPPFVFQLLKWERGESLESLLNEKRKFYLPFIGEDPHLIRPPSSSSSSSSPSFGSSPWNEPSSHLPYTNRKIDTLGKGERSQQSSQKNDPKSSLSTQLLPPAFVEEELVTFWICLLSLLEEQHRNGITHGQIQPRKILLHTPSQSSGESYENCLPHCPPREREIESGTSSSRGGEGQEKTEQGENLRLVEKIITLLDWQIGLEAKHTDEGGLIANHQRRKNAPGTSPMISSISRLNVSPSSLLLREKNAIGEGIQNPPGRMVSLEDETAELVRQARCGIDDLLKPSGGVCTRDIQQELQAFTGDQTCGMYAPPEQQMLHLYSASLTSKHPTCLSSLGDGDTNDSASSSPSSCIDSTCRKNERSLPEKRSNASPLFSLHPSLLLRKSWDLYAVARIIMECATLHAPDLSLMPAQVYWESQKKREEEERTKEERRFRDHAEERDQKRRDDEEEEDEAMKEGGERKNTGEEEKGRRCASEESSSGVIYEQSQDGLQSTVERNRLEGVTTAAGGGGEEEEHRWQESVSPQLLVQARGSCLASLTTAHTSLASVDAELKTHYEQGLLPIHAYGLSDDFVSILSKALHPEARQRFSDVGELKSHLEELRKNLQQLPKTLAQAARDCLPSFSKASTSSPTHDKNSHLHQGNRQGGGGGGVMDLSGVQFDPFRIRYLAKFARHLNVETLILPSSPFIPTHQEADKALSPSPSPRQRPSHPPENLKNLSCLKNEDTLQTTQSPSRDRQKETTLPNLSQYGGSSHGLSTKENQAEEEGEASVKTSRSRSCSKEKKESPSERRDEEDRGIERLRNGQNESSSYHSCKPSAGGGAAGGGSLGVSIPLAKMLNRKEICLDLSGKNLTSLEAALIARTLLTASWIEELHLNDNSFGSAPPRGMARAPLRSSSSSHNLNEDTSTISSSSSSATTRTSVSSPSTGASGDPTHSSTAAAQLLGVSLTCMKNLRVLDLNRCRLSPVDTLHLLECLRRCRHLRRLLLSSSMMCDSSSSSSSNTSPTAPPTRRTFLQSNRKTRERSVLSISSSPNSFYTPRSGNNRLSLASPNISRATGGGASASTRLLPATIDLDSGEEEGGGASVSTAGMNKRYEEERVCRFAAEALQKDWGEMEEVDFSDCEINDGGLDLLARAFSFHESIQSINLSGNPITVVGLRSLCRAMRSNRSVRVLSLKQLECIPNRRKSLSISSPRKSTLQSSSRPYSRSSMALLHPTQEEGKGLATASDVVSSSSSSSPPLLHPPSSSSSLSSSLFGLKKEEEDRPSCENFEGSPSTQRREDDGGLGSSLLSPSIEDQPKRESDKNEEEGEEEENRGEEGREEDMKAAEQRALDKSEERHFNLEREEEATLLLQMLQRAVGFNAQYTQLRRHTSAFEVSVGAPLMCETLASWLDGDSYLQKKLLSRLQSVRRIQEVSQHIHHSTGRSPRSRLGGGTGGGGSRSRPGGSGGFLSLSKSQSFEQDASDSSSSSSSCGEESPSSTMNNRGRDPSRRSSNNGGRVVFAEGGYNGGDDISLDHHSSRGRRNSARSRSREKLKEEDKEYFSLEVAVADLMLTSDGSALKRSLFPAFQATKDLKELEGILNITPSWMKPSGNTDQP